MAWMHFHLLRSAFMSKTPSNIVIDRYTVVAKLLAKVAAGMTLAEALALMTKTPMTSLNGRTLRLSKRTLQRWLAQYRAQGISGLSPISRRSNVPSKVLSRDFIDFLTMTKTTDPDASIPEVIRQGHLLGIIRPGESVSRVSVWRAAQRLHLPLFSDKARENDDKRRFSYAHRMQMTLSDGKHFRAGAKSRRRVVITILDDASRFVLGAAVGKTESSALFLSCLWKVILRWGLPDSLFMDNGSAFVAKDVATICARLDIKLIFGSEGYAEGHGKIERYHQSIKQDLLRSFRDNPAIDADCQALTLRIEHYNTHVYNRRGHESLGGISPEERFLSDKRLLRPVADPERIREYFVITSRRKVSRDHIVKVRGVPYEMPRGYAGTIVPVSKHLLDKTVSIIHEGKTLVLHRVDPVLNAKTPRRHNRRKSISPVPPRTAATLLFERDHSPLVSNAGDCHDKE
jgi:putative transposase